MTRTPKPKRGRPPLPDGRERLTTTLPRGYAQRLREIGGGNASAGIVRAVDGFTAAPPRPPRPT